MNNTEYISKAVHVLISSSVRNIVYSDLFIMEMSAITMRSRDRLTIQLLPKYNGPYLNGYVDGFLYHCEF
jgi:hypothetical protein